MPRYSDNDKDCSKKKIALAGTSSKLQHAIIFLESMELRLVKALGHDQDDHMLEATEARQKQPYANAAVVNPYPIESSCTSFSG